METNSLLNSGGKYHEDTFYLYKETQSESILRQNLIIFIHGIGGCSEQFDELSSIVESRGYDTLRYDLLGRGRSKYPGDNNFGEENHVAQLRSLITHLDIPLKYGKYNVVAHSMGGSLAACYISQHLSEVFSVSFLAPAGLMDLGPISILRNCGCCIRGIVKSILRSSQETAWKSDFIDTNASPAIHAIDVLRELNKQHHHIFDAFWNSVLQFPLSGIDSKVKLISDSKEIAVLLLAAEKDTAVPFNPNYQRWNNYFSGSDHYKTIVYKDLGHGFFVENAPMVGNDILTFLNEIYG
jgi:pimeloyl-ACP methyl ester carboxylesterase